ncbi:MAG: hypothetical protein KAJ54_03015 [Candidatus Aenigmarchaeota archaeon]|nr:hypothetical protein [Candidatus Aenigmarchaeota archaeon]
MGKTIIFLILTILILSNTATANDFSEIENTAIDKETLEVIKEQINNQDTDNKALNILRDTFGDEILEITLTETNTTFTIITKNGNLEDIKKEGDLEATIKLNMNETLFDDLKSTENAEDPAQLILDAVKNDKIEYQTTEKASLKTKILISLSKIMLNLAAFINGIISIF